MVEQKQIPTIELVTTRNTKEHDCKPHCGPGCWPPRCETEDEDCWPPLCYPNCNPSCRPECYPETECEPDCFPNYTCIP